MPASPRDRDALDLAADRSFGGAFVTDVALEMQARRLRVRLYGALRGGAETYHATLTFFGATALGIDNESGTFPESVAVASFAITFDDANDLGSADLQGRNGWSMFWSFDGLAYEETTALASSYRDDF